MIMARELRKKPTPSEARLWAALRRRQVGGYRFRRQHPVLGFVVDFYCPALQLAVEVDGGVHGEEGAAERDAARQELLEAVGTWFIRVDAADVDSDAGAVVTFIADTIRRHVASLDDASSHPEDAGGPHGRRGDP